MKHLVYIIILTTLLFTTRGIYAQTSVTGHIFAEVVESVSASSYSQASLTIQRNQTKGIDFGKIEIKSAESAMCSLILSKANLIGNDKKSISMETSMFSTRNIQGNAINGTHSISLQCQPDKNMLTQNTSFYTGDINIVLAYN